MYTSSSESDDVVRAGVARKRTRRGVRRDSAADPPTHGGAALHAAVGAAATGETQAPRGAGARNEQAGLTAAVPKAGLTADTGPGGSTAVAGPPAAWPMHLRAALAAQGQVATQQRALTMATAFTGLGSQRRMWDITGCIVREVAAAEPKVHAKQFLRDNALMAEHHFDDIRTLTAGGRAPCARHGGQLCTVPVERVDFFAGGFPCQPTSAQRRSRHRIKPEEHRLFDVVRWLVEYLRVRRPRVALLEQTTGALHQSVYDGAPTSECEWLRAQVADIYHMHVAALDVRPWIRMRRNRVWIFLVSRDVCGHNCAEEAARLAAAAQAHRRRTDAASLRAVLYTPAHRRWQHILHLVGEDRRAADRGGRDGHDPPPAWWQKCAHMRARWRAESRPWADDHPLAAALWRGCCRTDRTAEVLEVTLLHACARRGLNPRSPRDLEQAMTTTWCDYSQNHFATSEDEPGTVCTSTRLYDYVHDRAVLAEEVLLALGWCAGPPLETDLLQGAELHDLVGECQALQPLAVASWALLLTARDALSGLWSDGATASAQGPAAPGRHSD